MLCFKFIFTNSTNIEFFCLFPHLEQTIPIDGMLQFSQRRLCRFEKNDFDAADALRISLVIPPFSATGNNTWTGGFIKLGAAFSGLPILTPIDVENLFLISIPELAVSNSKIDLELSKIQGFPKLNGLRFERQFQI